MEKYFTVFQEQEVHSDPLWSIYAQIKLSQAEGAFLAMKIPMHRKLYMKGVEPQKFHTQTPQFLGLPLPCEYYWAG